MRVDRYDLGFFFGQKLHKEGYCAEKEEGGGGRGGGGGGVRTQGTWLSGLKKKTFTYPVVWLTVGAPQMTWQPIPSIVVILRRNSKSEDPGFDSLANPPPLRVYGIIAPKFVRTLKIPYASVVKE